ATAKRAIAVVRSLLFRGAMTAQSPRAPSAGRHNGPGRWMTRLAGTWASSYRARAWAAGVLAFLVLTALSVVPARIAADRRAAIIVGDLEQIAEGTSWPHQEYLRPRIGLARQ